MTCVIQTVEIDLGFSLRDKMSVITREEALELIENSSKYDHSVMVSRIMEALADIFHEDMVEWGLVGLLHDLDHDVIDGDMSKHGIVAAEMLKGRLSEGGLHAIRAHDHRAGVAPRGLLDESLIFADGLAVLVEDQGLSSTADAPALERALRVEGDEKPWVAETIRAYCISKGVEVTQILGRL